VATLINATVIVSSNPNRMNSTRTRRTATAQLHHKNDHVPRSSAACRAAF